jgi:hypothetical protein
VSTLTTLLIVGCLLLVASSLIALVFAITRAADGSEDAAGFHRDVQAQVAGTSPPIEGSNNPWDYVHGAHCPLNLNPSLGPIGNNQLSIHQ